MCQFKSNKCNSCLDVALCNLKNVDEAGDITREEALNELNRIYDKLIEGGNLITEVKAIGYAIKHL